MKSTYRVELGRFLQNPHIINSSVHRLLSSFLSPSFGILVLWFVHPANKFMKPVKVERFTHLEGGGGLGVRVTGAGGRNEETRRKAAIKWEVGEDHCLKEDTHEWYPVSQE
jgi:hypothetical protein